MWGPSFSFWLFLTGTSVTKIQDSGKCFEAPVPNVLFCQLEKQVCYIDAKNLIDSSDSQTIRCFKTINK